jgi:hypothetical protein
MTSLSDITHPRPEWEQRDDGRYIVQSWQSAGGFTVTITWSSDTGVAFEVSNPDPAALLQAIDGFTNVPGWRTTVHGVTRQ